MAMPRVLPRLRPMFESEGEVMQRKHKIRGAVLALAALSALAVTSAAPAQSTATVTIRHQMRGCHSWSFNCGPF
jgi:hypothetical protein